MPSRRDFAILAGLVALACLVQVVLVSRAAVCALDAVNLVRISQRIGEHGLRTTLETEREQPLFPLAVWLAHRGLLRAIGPFPSAWALSAQIAAAAALVLAVIPVYFLSLRLAGRPAAIAGGLLFCLLPEVSRRGADGIADSTHLLFFSLALWATVRYLTDGANGALASDSGRPPRSPAGAGHPVWLLVAGSAAGAALLTRAETLVFCVALVVVLAIPALTSRNRSTWRGAATASGCFAAGAALVLAPYLVWIGAITPHAAVCRILGRESGEQTSRTGFHARPAASLRGCPPLVDGRGSPSYLPPGNPGAHDSPDPAWLLPNGEPMSFAAQDPTISIRRRGWEAAARVGDKLFTAFGYWTGPLAVLGAWSLWRRSMRRGEWFGAIFCGLYLLAALAFSLREGYLESRHFLILVVTGTGAAGYGALELGRWIALKCGDLSSLWKRPQEAAGRCSAERSSEASLAKMPRKRRSIAALQSRSRATTIAGWAVVGIAVMGYLPYLMLTTHRTQLGHRAAAEWLARNAAVPGDVLDTQGWTGLYSGRRTYPYEDAHAVLTDSRLAYLVVEDRELARPSNRGRTLCRLLETGAEPCAAFASPAGKRVPGFRVLVYRWFPERVSQLALQ